MCTYHSLLTFATVASLALVACKGDETHGTGGGGASSSSTSMEPVCPTVGECPEGAYATCEVSTPEVPVVAATCCTGGVPFPVCALARGGILSNVCPGCDGPGEHGVCAIGDGATVCCVFGGCQ